MLLEEHVNGEWIGWAIDLPEDPDDDPAADPTTGGELPAPGEYLRLIIDAMIRRAEQVKWDLESEVESHAAVTAGGWLARAEQVLDRSEVAAIAPVLLAAGIFTDRGVVSVARHAAKPLLRAAHDLAAALPADPRLHSRAHLALIAFLVRDGVATAHAVLGLHAADHEARRLDDLLSLAGATVVGLIDDDVLKQGFEAINDVDWTVWMGRHGARPEALASAMVRGIYDYVFGYEGGHADRRALEAGTAVHGILRLFFTYKGSLFWEMQAGMGDVVFAPTYEVLRSRGVKFRFFHAVESLDADEAGTAVQQIRIRRQARVKGDVEYAPLERINGVPSWPSVPDLSQLENGDTLKDAAFESAWAPPTGDIVTLSRGTDFDDVILGISIGGVKNVCRALGAPDSAFQRMLGAVQTVQTCSMQLWLVDGAAGAGVPQPAPIASCYVDDLNTWADMTFLLPRETWPAGGPQCILYVCGQFPDADVIPPFQRPRLSGPRTRAASRKRRRMAERQRRGHLGAHGIAGRRLRLVAPVRRLRRRR